MFFKPYLLLIPFLSINILLADEEAKELFNDAACMECHNPEDFAHKKGKVTNFKKLHKAVDACRFANGAEWFDDESLSVSKYLNKKYYKYKDTNIDN